jgi:hypothetical protein
MSLLSRLFGGASAPAPEAEPEIYKGYRIYPEPVKEGALFRVAARIEKEIGGEIRTHRLVRADTCDSAETAAQISAGKARTMIDEQGDAIFG